MATRQQQSWGDEDIVETLGFVDERLKEGIVVLSNFEKYKKEVMSGQLEWSPMHTSELFWRQNVEKFEERDFAVLRALLKLIELSRDVSGCARFLEGLGRRFCMGAGSVVVWARSAQCCPGFCVAEPFHRCVIEARVQGLTAQCPVSLGYCVDGKACIMRACMCPVPASPPVQVKTQAVACHDLGMFVVTHPQVPDSAQSDRHQELVSHSPPTCAPLGHPLLLPYVAQPVAVRGPQSPAC